MEISGTSRTADGYLVADAPFARIGIYEYAGREMGMPEKTTVKIQRDGDVVFSDASMASFSHKPITLGHPPVNVNRDNWSKFAKGYTGDWVKQDGKVVRTPMIVKAGDAIDAVEAGTVELSAGYSVEVDMTPGINDEGEAYDGRMVGDIIGNHIAIVPRGRAGSMCRIGDAWDFNDDDSKETPMTTKTITFDGLPLLVTDAAEAAIAKRDAQLLDAAAALTAEQGKVATLTTTISTKDAEIVTITAARDAAVVTPAKLAEMVAARAATVADAKVLAPSLTVTDAMTDADIRKGVVLANVGDAAKDWTDEQFAASFATLPRAGGTAMTDGIRATFLTPSVGSHAASESAWQDSVNDLNASRTAK